MLLGTGVRARTALVVAQDVLDTAGGVRGLLRIGVDELRRVSGVGAPRAARLLAAIELGRRAMVAVPRASGRACRTAGMLGRYLMPLYSGHREERFGVVMLDAKHRLLRSEILSVGSLDSEHRASARDLPRRDARVGSGARVVPQSSFWRSGAEPG